jgi:hypothetical protein
LSTRTDHTQVIRGLRDGKVVYVFATNQTRGFQVAGDLDLEGIPSALPASCMCGAPMFGSRRKLANRVVPQSQLISENPEILAAHQAEHDAQVEEGQAKMRAQRRP